MLCGRLEEVALLTADQYFPLTASKYLKIHDTNPRNVCYKCRLWSAWNFKTADRFYYCTSLFLVLNHFIGFLLSLHFLALCLVLKLCLLCFFCYFYFSNIYCRNLYVVYGQIIRAYSTHTGELVRDYRGLSQPAIGVQLHPTRPELVVAVSESGELMAWRWESGIHMLTVVSFNSNF